MVCGMIGIAIRFIGMFNRIRFALIQFINRMDYISLTRL